MEEQTPEFAQVAQEFKEFIEKMRDPVVVGALLNKLSEERRSTNLLLKEIYGKFERLEARINELEQRLAIAGFRQAREEVLLSDVDEKLVEFVRKHARVCAEDVQRKFSYKGRNAASARLNALWKQGVLDKKFAGKTTYFEIALR